MSAFTYVGSELGLFAKAVNWKAYWRSQMVPYIHGDVLEVGAGIGTNTRFFPMDNVTSWTCLEPDVSLCEQMRAKVPALPNLKLVNGILADVPTRSRFDAIIYVDVLEHIEDDVGELRNAVSHLHDGGNLIVLSPAHQWLFTPFDQAIGHFRRYSAPSLSAVAPPGISVRCLRYLDSVGMLASIGNRLLLKQSHPSDSQILLWDRYMVPLSRILDRIFLYRCGKSVLAIWRREAVWTN